MLRSLRVFMLSVVPVAMLGLAVSESMCRAVDAPPKITHSFLATGGETYILDGEGQVTWSYPKSTRDGWVLPSGNILLALSKSNDGGSVVEVTREGKTVFEFKGTQSEVNTAQALENGNILLTEAGAKPRLLEVTRDGKIAVEVALQAQTKDHHLQTRMARKLKNGNYLVPQLLDKVVREYQPDGKVVWEGNKFPVVLPPNTNPRRISTGGILTLSPNTTPGEYLLEVLAIPRDGKSPTLTQWTDFNLL